MKKTAGRSSPYWCHQAEQFSDLYALPPLLLSPSSIVARFLKDRTNCLLSLLPPAPYKHLLDLGCGSGPHMQLLRFQAHRMTGVDYSESMLKLARSNLKKNEASTGLRPWYSAKADKTCNWRLICADAASVPAPRKSFDCIISMGLLDYVRSPLDVLHECRRIITDDGVLVVSIPKRPSIFSLLRTPIGESIKRHVFHLPPIDNALTKNEFLLLFQKARFHVTGILSVWNAMWMVRAIPKKR